MYAFLWVLVGLGVAMLVRAVVMHYYRLRHPKSPQPVTRYTKNP